MSETVSSGLVADTKINHFRVLGLLGKGGMGAVYKAEDVNLGRQVALKVLSPALLEIEGYKDRFFREAQSAARVQHPNIVSIYHLGTTSKGSPYFAMELVDGEALDEVLHRVNRFSLEKSVELLTPVIEALSFAHGQGIIHRDLKPANLVLGKDNRIRVLDFGLARMEGSTSLTNTGMVMGTPDFMSPEQGLGKKVDHRADIYSIGVIFYVFLTGRLPFEGDSALEVMMAHVQTPPPSVRKCLPDLSPYYSQIIHRCLEKAPEDRFQSYQELLEALKNGPKPTSSLGQITDPLANRPVSTSSETKVSSDRSFANQSNPLAKSETKVSAVSYTHLTLPTTPYV